MKNEWKIKKIYEVCDIFNGSTPLRSNKEFWENGDVPWFTIDDIREQGRIINFTKQKITKKALEKTSVKLLPPESILLCCTASVGEYAIVKIPTTTNQQFNGLVVKNQDIICPLFLFYFVSTLKEQLLRLSGKTTIDFIPISRLREIEIPLPPLEEQKRIVKILDEVFEGIEKVKENALRNLRNSREVFEAYLQSVFTNHCDNWKIKKLKEVCDYDKVPNKKTGLPYVGLEDIESNTSKLIGPTTPRVMKSLTFIFNNEHVLYGRLRPYLNKVLLPSFEGHCSTEIFPIKPKKDLDRRFLFHWLTWSETVKKINATWTGATLPRANMNEVLEFLIPLPPFLEQQSIIDKLDALAIQTKSLESLYQSKFTLLEELKKSILQKAFSGGL